MMLQLKPRGAAGFRQLCTSTVIEPETRKASFHLTVHAKGENIMSGSGKRDKGNKEQKKKAKHDIKEKRKLKKEKKQKNPFMPA